MFTEEHCGRLRELVDDCLKKHLERSAVFYADKLVSLSGSNPDDIYLLAQAYFASKEYRRAVNLLRCKRLLDSSPNCRYLAARCLAECGDWEECLSVLGDGEGEDPMEVDDSLQGGASGESINWYSTICLMRGRIFENMENPPRALMWYKKALKSDPFCFDAFHHLVERHLLSNTEEKELVSELQFNDEDNWLKLLYACKCKKYDEADNFEEKIDDLERPSHSSGAPVAPLQPSATVNQPPSGANTMDSPEIDVADLDIDIEQNPGWGLVDNVDVLACKAEVKYYRGAYREAYDISRDILKRDPDAHQLFPVYLASCLELDLRNELFLKAHQLTKKNPERAISWYAVGVYYMCIKRYENARRFFGKANSIDRYFAPSWIGFGNAFAAQDEADQAMAAFRTAARRFPGLHLPLIYIGMEYQRMNNLPLAKRMFLSAKDLCPLDPLAHNELGILAFRNGEYGEAVAWFRRAIELIPGREPTPAWEPTLINLGHALRKQCRYTDAIKQYEKALALCPMSASTATALGFSYHLQIRIPHAIEYYHKALALNPEDQFAQEMLQIAVQEDCSRPDDDQIVFS